MKLKELAQAIYELIQTNPSVEEIEKLLESEIKILDTETFNQVVDSFFEDINEIR